MSEATKTKALEAMLTAFTGDGFECDYCILQQTTCENNDPSTNEECPVNIARKALNIE